MKAEEAVKLIMENQLVLDCPKMLLSPQLPASPQTNYSGPGFISQNDAGVLTFKMFCTDGPHFEDLVRYFNITPGKIIGEEHYYSLSATDIRGRLWEANWIDPDTNSGPTGSIVQGKINELYYAYGFPIALEGYSANIYFPGDIEIPCNKKSIVETSIDGKKVRYSINSNTAKFKACGFEFELKKEKDWLVFHVQSNSREINISSIMRFTEALQFVLSRSLSWSILELIHDQDIKLTVRPLYKNDKKLSIGPPIALKQCRDRPNIVWILFQKYLEHVIDYQEDSWHPIFDWMHKVIESESSSIDVQALVRSVAIEGILKSEFSDLTNLDGNLQSQINKAKKIILNSDLEDNFKKRLNGSLSSMLNPRPKDRLHILRTRGFVDDLLINEYGKLRDSSTHGDLFSEIHIQEFFNRCNSVLVLFYHLIFTAIGYKGPYTDYSTYNFPLKDFGISSN